jgi:shikimate dehydrogenase
MMFRLAVFGDPVSHSRSPEIHSAFARQANIQVEYQKIRPVSDFASAVRRFVDSGATGFNVTLPFKQEAYDLCSARSAAASRSGAVNTVVVDKTGLRGDNTDGVGLVKDLSINLGWPIAGARVLILGAGGVVRGVLPAVLDAAPAAVHLYNRTYDRARQIADSMDETNLLAVNVDQLEDEYDLVINGTSAGLSGDVPSVKSTVIGPDSRCYDMIYGQTTTAFNSWATTTCHCKAAADGLGMLVEQAAEAFRVWFDFSPQTSAVIRVMRGH